MAKEMTAGQKLAEELLYTRKNVSDVNPAVSEKAQEFCEGYKDFLNHGKTEREVTAYAEKLLLEKGYQPFCPGTKYPAGFKVYYINRGKNVIASTIGTAPLEEGFRLNIAHIDSPRIDLKPVPLYEDGNLALLKTHYYGGIRKYQWPTMPLSLHGVLYKANGEKVTLCVGEDPEDPVFCITDLLPHLAQEQSQRKLAEGIQGEELNIVICATPIDDEEVKDRVKLNAMKLLNEKYGIVEKDFIRAEIEAVPAHKARDVGFDRALIGAYGHDDRVDAYPALIAEINTVAPKFTTVCVLADKEETGSDGVTGLASEFTFHYLKQMCQGQEADYITAVKHSKCLSADVLAAFDPTFPSAFEKLNSVEVGRGIGIAKYTGARGKSGTTDAAAELVAYLIGLLDDNNIVWQTGELGRDVLGGGGTVAKFVANHDIDTIDIGVPVLSMHSPFELVHKNDVYMAYEAFAAFNKAEK